MGAKPSVKLVGEDGNVFAIMGRVTKALKRAGMADRAEEYLARVMNCRSYDDALMITLEYVDEPDGGGAECPECGGEAGDADELVVHLTEDHGWDEEDALFQAEDPPR